MIVYDITKKDSFLHIKDWIEEISKYTGPAVDKIVLGNKSDLQNTREVTPEEQKDFTDKNNIKIIEVSAKESLNVELAFRTVVETLIENKY